MLNSVSRQIIAVAAALFVPAVVSAQQGVPGVQLPAEAEGLIAEMEQIQAQLQPIQLQVMQDPEVQSAQESLGEQVEAAMAQIDPTTPQRIERLQSLASEAQAAQQAQDEQKMTEIITEAQQIEQQLQATQAAALESPGLAAEIDRFQTQVQAKMMEIDPQTESLIDRFEELDRQLTALLRQG